MGRQQRRVVSLAFYFALVGGFVTTGFYLHPTAEKGQQVSPPAESYYSVDACISSDGDEQACREDFQRACANGVREACAALPVGTGSTIGSGRITISNRP
jgi:hypothetical protein